MSENKQEKLKITNDCWFERDGDCVTLNYIEHSTDFYTPDYETYVDIDLDDAEKIIEFLKKNVVDIYK